MTSPFFYEGEVYATKHQRQETRPEIQPGTPKHEGDQQPTNNVEGRIPPLDMACEKPNRGYKAANGRLVFFKSTQKEYWQQPYNGLQVPCGTCILCREEQSRQQAIRITHEAECHSQNSFITATYADDKLPKYGSLEYRHLVTFWKRA